jgi:hypothetical protein
MKLTRRDVLLLVATFLLITSMLLFFVGPEFIQSRYYTMQHEAKGAMGDAFGGTISPLIAWIAAVLTFAAFYIQYEANKEQRNQFAEQAKDTAKQRFENIFYELIKLHRDNVSEMNIEDSVRGRKAFTSFYYEYRYIYFVFAKYYYELGDHFSSRKNEEFELTNISYLVFFFGLGYNSNNVTRQLFEKYENMHFFNKAVKRLKRERLQYKTYKESKRDMKARFNGDIATFRIKYQPFNGHTGKLGHYFRHLFQTVKFVDEQDDNIVTSKYDYVKTLRAQLSNFEQLLLYYNSLSVLGSDWILNEYMHKYEMARNIPIPFANFGIQPEMLFKTDIESKFMSFEWTEVKQRIDNYDMAIDRINAICRKSKIWIKRAAPKNV